MIGLLVAAALITTATPAAAQSGVTVNRSALSFAATDTGSSITPAQTVTVSFSSPPADGQTWTASASQPWIVIARPVDSGANTFTVGIATAAYPIGTMKGTVTVSAAGYSPATLAVTLTVAAASAATAPPFGSFDTPAGDGSDLAGSVAVTGWALDNIALQRVELWRDLQAGETTPPFSSSPSDPRRGKVFIANATFVEGARPDVEALYPNTPASYRAGWGYLLLTWGLWNQGNGSYTLYAFAFDQDNNVATLGSKTIAVNNNAAAKPFGSIDTPAIGGTASGPNYGWALTPKVNGVASCRIPLSGVQYSIDSGPLQPAGYADPRSDIAQAFPGFSNSDAAGGHAFIDWSALAPGTHTIGWLVTDDCNRSDGIGSRFFNVSSTATQSGMQAASVTTANGPEDHARARESTQPILLARGAGALPERIDADAAGIRRVEMTQAERIEMRLPPAFAAAYQIGPDGHTRSLPVGATWDRAAGIFSWQPAPGFLGMYRLVFSDGIERLSVEVVIVARRDGAGLLE